MIKSIKLKNTVSNNFRLVTWWLSIPPLAILISLFLILLNLGATSSAAGYIIVQKYLFFFINNRLAQYPELVHNLTYLGDACILYTFLIILVFSVPKLWQALLSSSIITLILSALLKNLFSIPRPATFLEHGTFIIIGKPATGFHSLPSGHSMTIAMTMTVLLFGLMPNKWLHRLFWTLFIFGTIAAVAFSRVAVGAHYPVDVIVGSTLGYLAGIAGIISCRNSDWMDWALNKKYYPIFMILLPVWIFLIGLRISDIAMPVYYLAIVSLTLTLLTIVNAYFKKH